MNIDYPKQYLYKRIVNAKLFIDAHYGDDIVLDNIADEAYFSKFHFIRLFKQVYGETPHQYLTKVRMSKAKELLANGFSVSETCSMVGFDSLGSFTGLFKRYMQLSPSAFQRKEKLRIEQVRNLPLHFVPACFAEQHGWKENSNFQQMG